MIIPIGASIEAIRMKPVRHRPNGGRKEYSMLYHPEDIGDAPKVEAGLEKISDRPESGARFPKARFTVLGEEIIDKQVKAGGNAGRVYLPIDWVGKHVKIIRID